MKDWPFVERWVPFLYTFWGRGGWYLFWSLLVAACVKIKIYGAFASSSTPSTRRLLDGVEMPVPHRSMGAAPPRHRREMT